jgi:hypothetical protein
MIKRQIYPHIWDSYFKLRSKYKIVFKRQDFDPTRVPIFLDPVSSKEMALSHRLMAIGSDDDLTAAPVAKTAATTTTAATGGRISGTCTNTKREAEDVAQLESRKHTSDDLLEMACFDSSNFENDTNVNHCVMPHSIFDFPVTEHCYLGKTNTIIIIKSANSIHN